MNYLTTDDLNDLIRLIEDSEHRQDEYDKSIFSEIMTRLTQEYRHCKDEF